MSAGEKRRCLVGDVWRFLCFFVMAGTSLLSLLLLLLLSLLAATKCAVFCFATGVDPTRDNDLRDELEMLDGEPSVQSSTLLVEHVNALAAVVNAEELVLVADAARVVAFAHVAWHVDATSVGRGVILARLAAVNWRVSLTSVSNNWFLGEPSGDVANVLGDNDSVAADVESNAVNDDDDVVDADVDVDDTDDDDASRGEVYAVGCSLLRSKHNKFMRRAVLMRMFSVNCSSKNARSLSERFLDSSALIRSTLALCSSMRATSSAVTSDESMAALQHSQLH
jgi:hypothetical protein